MIYLFGTNLASCHKKLVYTLLTDFNSQRGLYDSESFIEGIMNKGNYFWW